MGKKVLFTATVVKTHIMQFHIPYLKMLQEMGWETAVAARNDYENPADCQIPYCDHYFDIHFERLPWKKGNINAYKLLKRVIDEGNYDIIHCHTPVGALLTRLAARNARKKGTKVIYTAHGFHFFKGAPLMNWLLFYPAEKIAAPMTDVLITINKEDYGFARKKLRAKRVEYVPGVGIRTERFQKTEEVRRAKRTELGFTDQDYLMLTVAEMTANKNHITILKALSLLKDQEEYTNMHYLICGRGEQWHSLVESAAELGISDHVHFLGYRKDAPELYGASDLFLFMSFREGLPVALMEAMSSGLGIVCSRIRGNVDLIEDGKNGLFTDNNPEALAHTILWMYRNPELAERLGRNAAQSAQAYDEESILSQVKEIYRNV